MNTIFRDSFDNRTVLGTPYVFTGAPSVASGTLSLPSAGNVAIVPDIAPDGEFSVIGTTGSGGSGPVASLVFRYKDASNFWYAYHYPVGGNLQIRKTVAGADSGVFSGSNTVAGTYTYTVRAFGGSIVMLMDGVVKITGDMSTAEIAASRGWGGVGARSSGGVAVFDDLVVRVPDRRVRLPQRMR